MSADGGSGVWEDSREDEILVRECLHGNERAWSALIDKYKQLIFSIPVKYGFSPDDSNEIFQAVCFTLLHDLSQLREPRALAAWLIRTTARTCNRYRQERRIYAEDEPDENRSATDDKPPEKILEELEREQTLREALGEQSPECQALIQLLFFADPPLRYEEAAQKLGMAKGSVGATRIRCLEKLRRFLEARGFR